MIEEANWLTLSYDISHLIGEGFDAVICLGNSFAHMPDSYGDQREQKYATAIYLYRYILSIILQIILDYVDVILIIDFFRAILKPHET